MRPRTIALLVASVVVLSHEVGYAATVNLCISHTGSYTDNVVASQDYWRDDGPKRARGARTRIYNSGTLIFDGYLDDGFGGAGIGCTGYMLLPDGTAFLEFYVASEGEVQSNHIGVTNPDDNIIEVYNSAILWTVGYQPQMIPITLSVGAGETWDVMNTYQAAAYAMYRHAGGLEFEEIRYWVNADIGTFYCDHHTLAWQCDDHHGTVFVQRNIPEGINLTTRMFILVHETGHWMGDVGTDGVMDAQTVDVSYTSGDDGCESEPGHHGMRSEEYAGGAAGEGFAHFYSADVFNSHDAGDCSIPNGGDDVDCQTGAPAYDEAYHEAYCGGTTWRGVELDWLRAFWDVHTRGAAPDPSFTWIVDWMDDALPWTRTNAYSNLNAAAWWEGGDLYDNWEFTKEENGVWH